MTHRLNAFVSKVTALCNGFLKVYRYEIEAQKHAGGTHLLTWEVMEHGDAVAVLGYDPAREEIVLVNELGPGALAAGDYPYADNLVGGRIAADEAPLDAAVREMKEEAGLDIRDPIVIHGGAYVSPGATSERVTIVAGIVDTSRAGGIHGAPDEQEDILTIVLPATAFIDRARRGEITDLRTLVAAYWLAEHPEFGKSTRDPLSG